MNQHWKVLKTEADYKTALERLDEIAEAELDTQEGDELELLVLLIKAYEDRHYPFKLPEPLDMIKLRMEEMNLKNKDLVEIIGSESHVSSVLSGKRQITLEMARKLSKRLNIRASIFINDEHSFEEYEKDSTAPSFQDVAYTRNRQVNLTPQCSHMSDHKELDSILSSIGALTTLSSQRSLLKNHSPFIISYAHDPGHESIYILIDLIKASIDPTHIHVKDISEYVVRLENEKVK